MNNTVANKELDEAVKNFKIAMLNALPDLIKIVVIIEATLIGAAIMMWLDGRL